MTGQAKTISIASGSMPGTAAKQICFRINETTAEEIQAAAMLEGYTELGPFCRELMKWAFGHYKQASSLFLLKKARVVTPQVGTKKNRSHL